MKKNSGDKYGLIMAGAAILLVVAVLFLPRNPEEPLAAGIRQPEAKLPPADHGKPLIGRPPADSLVFAVLTPPGPVVYTQLLHRIDTLPDTLTEAETYAICRALRDGLAEYRSLPPGQKHHLGNQLMDAILRQKTAPGGVAEELADIWKSSTADETLRDYALQHLAQLLEGRGPASAHLAAWRSTGIPVLLDAARAAKTRSAGTALLALHFLSDPGSPTSVDVAELNGLIDSTAGNDAAHPAARAAAFQTASARKRSHLIEPARRLAGDKGVDSGLRVSAIHYLGTCGEATDSDLLAAIERENDLRYRTASQSARTRMLSRLP